MDLGVALKVALAALTLAVIVLALAALVRRKPLLALSLMGAVATLVGLAMFVSVAQPVAVGPRTVVISTDATSAVGPDTPESPTVLPPVPGEAMPTWENGVLTLTGQAPLPYPPNAARPDRDRAEARRAARRQATQALAQYLAQLRQVAPAYLADVQSLLQRLPDVEHAHVAEALVNGAATVKDLESDTGCTVRVAIGRDKLRDALGAGRRYARRGQSWAAALAAVGLVILSGAVLRASTRRVRAARR